MSTASTRDTSYHIFDQVMPMGEEGTEYAIRWRMHNGRTGLHLLGTNYAEAIIRAARYWTGHYDPHDVEPLGCGVAEADFVSRPLHQWSPQPRLWMTPKTCLEAHGDHDFQKSDSPIRPDTWVFCTRCGSEP